MASQEYICYVCNQPIDKSIRGELTEDFIPKRIFMHKRCWKCTSCNTELWKPNCSMKMHQGKYYCHSPYCDPINPKPRPPPEPPAPIRACSHGLTDGCYFCHIK